MKSYFTGESACRIIYILISIRLYFSIPCHLQIFQRLLLQLKRVYIILYPEYPRLICEKRGDALKSKIFMRSRERGGRKKRSVRGKLALKQNGSGNLGCDHTGAALASAASDISRARKETRSPEFGFFETELDLRSERIHIARADALIERRDWTCVFGLCPCAVCHFDFGSLRLYRPV